MTESVVAVNDATEKYGEHSMIDTAMQIDRITTRVKAVDEDEENNNNNDNIDIVCPLFMDGLPSNFTLNPQLCAIASLLENTIKEEVEECCDNNEEDTIIQKKKYQRDTYRTVAERKKQQQRKPISVCNKKSTIGKSSRYKVDSSVRSTIATQRKKEALKKEGLSKSKHKDRSNREASVGETTLFLNMWKI